MLKRLFAAAQIPAGRILLVHVRLRGISGLCGGDYAAATTAVLDGLLAACPQLLLVPAYTIYSFLAGRVYHRRFSRSEVGRFSEELRQRGCRRSSDPMYSLLQISGSLPEHLDYSSTLGDGSVCSYLYRHNAVIVNVDMPGFYATPVHALELRHAVPYRRQQTLAGVVLDSGDVCRQVSYRAYLRPIAADGRVYPPYNQWRRRDYLRQQGVINTVAEHGVHLEWAELEPLAAAIDAVLRRDKLFLVDGWPP